MLPIEWYSNESHVFANPKLTCTCLPSDWEGFKNLSGHIWLATSGTTQKGHSIKWVALSKKAFLASAEAVNIHMNSTSKDIWLNALPLFHVGGLSIYARAYMAGAKIQELNATKWDKDAFIEALRISNATLTSLVPAQAYDLVTAGYMSPPELRAVIIGGGALPLELFQKAKSLNWPLVPSYGMSECASQVATAKLGEYSLSLLPHIQSSVSEEGLLQLKSPALFSGYLRVTGEQFLWEDPKKNGVFTTEDRVEIKEGTLTFLGRSSDWIQIGGENVSLFALETFFNQLKPPEIDAVLTAPLDERLGRIVELVTLKHHEHQVQSLIQTFNIGAMPYEKIRSIRFVESIPRSALGKPLK